MESLLNFKGLGVKSVEKLAHLNIFASKDLLLHLPFRYLDKTKFADLSSVNIGDEVLLKLTIKSTETIGFGGKSQFICYLEDGNLKKISWRFFNFSQFQRQNLVRGFEVECFGEVKITRLGLEMIHPEYKIISKDQNTLLDKNLTPVYFCTDGITQNQMRSWTKQEIDIYNKNNENSDFKTAINLLHSPNSDENIADILDFKHKMQQKLIVEEFASRKLYLLQAREKIQQQKTAKLIKTGVLLNKLKIGFELTNSQKQVIIEIEKDLAQTKPMLRLLQGDVGCGKTIVAIIASIIAVENDKQVAIIAPTAILANQHYTSFMEILQNIDIKIAFLISSQNVSLRNENLAMIASDADIIIGTHSVFQDGVIFRDLGLVVIDEQHKFGVEQRLQLSQKAKATPHTLAMSATPIPRSLMMTAYGQMDISVIDEMPKGRKSIKTVVIGDAKKLQLLDKINQVCKQNHQVYWVCVMIDESEGFNAISATSSFEFLQSNLPNLTIGLIHGKTKKEQKEQIMADFKSGKINVLVATTVIEVGVNVPNANLMIVENAEKLGLASLHQLRGRVGRGSAESLCILMYSGKLSDNAKQRLKVLRDTNDGFQIAKKDLELRGAGEVLGVNQSGIASFKIANLVRDEYLLDEANTLAFDYYKKSKSEQDDFIKRWVTDKNQEFVKS